MKEIQITIPGPPIAQARPKFYRRGNFVGTYSPQHTEAGRWLLTARQQITEKVPSGVPIKLRAIFYMPIPKSLSPKKKIALIYHIKKPDATNLVKFVEDCLNGEAWHDDSQICEIMTAKIYGQNPRTEILIQWDD
jgi:Holliday junction resolvase RusA-like endonuclease